MNVKCRTRPSLAWVWACAQPGSSGPYQSLPPRAAHPGDPMWPSRHPVYTGLSLCFLPRGVLRLEGRGPQLPPGSSGESALLRPISCVAHGGTEAGARAPRTEAIQAARIVGGKTETERKKKIKTNKKSKNPIF